MAILVLIEALFSCMFLARRSAASALVSVWLPVLMLTPGYVLLRLPHIPPLTFASASILPVGFAMFIMLWRGRLRWEFRRTDLWVALFIVVYGVSDGMRVGAKTGLWDIFDWIFCGILPYMAGRLLIERYGVRNDFVKRFVVLLAVVAVISVYDFRMGVSSTQIFWSHLLSYPMPKEWAPQMRWGFGRIAGPYAHAILAGMMFLTGIVLCLWLRRACPDWGRRRLLEILPLQLRTVVLLCLIAGLLMTQSRGPWIGTAFALGIVWVGRQTWVRHAAWKLALVVAGVAIFGYGMLGRYTEGDVLKVQNQEQQTAVYRRNLIPVYLPIVEQRPVVGWGVSDYPKVSILASIDNEYLWLAVTNGLAGLALFLMIVAENWRGLVLASAAAADPVDRSFAFALMAVLGGLLVTLTTVYLGMQVFQLFFLLTGWIVSLRPVQVSPGLVRSVAPRPYFQFRRVFS